MGNKTESKKTKTNVKSKQLGLIKGLLYGLRDEQQPCK